MKYEYLGRSGVRVSRICLGTMNFGTVTDEEVSREILDTAADAGVNFIDTADVYGSPPSGSHAGLTEEIVGRWLTGRGSAARDQIVLATKVYGRMGDGPNDQNLSALHIRQAVDASLRRLGTDRIELYQMHHIDRRTPVDEILQAFTVLRDQGKVLYLGSSNFAGWNIAQYQEHARAHDYLAPISEQSIYNLANRSLELEVIPAAQHYGVGVLPYAPLAGGLLAGVLKKRVRSRSLDVDGGLEWTGATMDQLSRYESLADRLSIDAAHIGLAWLLHQPAVSAAIIGPRTQEQLSSALAALTVELSVSDLRALDEIWPGPKGQAPEAYAW